MELTKEHFDQVVAGLVSKDDLRTAVAPLATKADVREGVEELARMVSAGFEDIRERLDVRDRVTKVEAKVAKIGEALHLEL